MMRLMRDSVAWRFGLTIAAALAVTCVLIGLFYAFGGIWARPSNDSDAQIDGIASVIQITEATPPADRRKLAHTMDTRHYQGQWYAAGSKVARWLDEHGRESRGARSYEIGKITDYVKRTVVYLSPDDPLYHTPAFPLRSSRYPHAFFVGVRLKDASWLVAMGYERYWGLSQSRRLSVWLVFLVLAVIGVSAVTTRLISRPIRQFADAVRRAGENPKAPPLAESGPQELREAISAFNEMQAKIQEFIAYRIDMLAAISHDLRTPLTRMRLRGEYIEDRVQRDRLFRDVDEMQMMIDGALAFFRGDGDTEATRTFDLAGILQSIVDDFADQNIDVGYTGPDHALYSGRPIALKRAVTNLVVNAVQYATPPQIELSLADETISIAIRDRGPGIPAGELEKVFKPFYRLDKSRNRTSGGVGLGLTAAQAVVRGHGGTLRIDNRPEGGLAAIVTLPRASASRHGEGAIGPVRTRAGRVGGFRTR